MKAIFKHISMPLLSLALAAGMVVPAVTAYSKREAERQEIGEDNAIYDVDTPRSVDNPDYSYRERDPSETTVNKVIIHYYNEDAKTNTRAFYIWNTGIGGFEYSDEQPAGETKIVTYSSDNTSMTITLDYVNDERFVDYKELPSLMFIIKYKRTPSSDNWTGQSADTELRFDAFPPKDGVVEAWATPASGNMLALVDSEAKTRVNGVKNAEFTNWKTIHCTSTKDTQAVEWILYGYDETYYKRAMAYRAGYQPFYEIKRGSSASPTFDISLKYDVHINMVYTIISYDPNESGGLTKMATVSFGGIYESAKFKQYYNYDGDDLGFTYTPEQTTFKVWAPTSANMTLMLYTSDTSRAFGGNDKYDAYHMNYVSGGIWTITLTGNLKGKYYNYQADNTMGTNIAMDPYATTAGRSGVRGMVYDKAETNPENWDELPLKWDGNTSFKWNNEDPAEKSGLDITTPQELTIYEVHMMDFTGDESWVSNNGNKRGTMNAFVESGTTLESDPSVKTGYDHLDELGIDAVQIMPIYDIDNNENTGILSYNWGYNPLNYNVVEGGYSSGAYNGILRVKEFKNLVMRMSQTKAHTRVIMDVVYNHVSSAAASCFNKLVPMYYFRYAEDGSLYNGSGCGNEVKSDAPMMRKYIVDSMVMWATEYKIKGFRFDLMGLIDITTLKEVQKALYKIDPDIYIYGEGWTGDTSGFDWDTGTVYPVHGTSGKENWGGVTKAVYSELWDTTDKIWIGCFNDGGRNALRGGNDPGWGFMQKGSDASVEDRDRVSQMIWGGNGNTAGGQVMGMNPKQTINYASCHDNFTLFDQLYITLSTYDEHGDWVSSPSGSIVVNASLAAHSLIFASNSSAFMLGGEELFRSKELTAADREKVESSTWCNKVPSHYFSHNSYNAPLSVNAFNWNNKKSITVDGVSVNTSSATAKFAEMIQLHHTMPKYDFDEVLERQQTTSKGKTVENLSWSGNYNGAAGFQFDEWFIYAAGREFGYISAGGVTKWTQRYSCGVTAFDGTYQTVNLGTTSPNAGGACVIYYADGKRQEETTMKKTIALIIPLMAVCLSGCFLNKKNSSGNSSDGGGNSSESSGSSSSSSPKPVPKDKEATYYFYLDYSHSDTPILKYKWYLNEPLGSCPEEAILTDADAPDPLYPKFLGYSQHSSSNDESYLWDFATESAPTQSAILLYGVWATPNE